MKTLSYDAVAGSGGSVAWDPIRLCASKVMWVSMLVWLKAVDDIERKGLGVEMVHKEA